MATALRNVRIPDEIWQPAKERAAWRDENLSEVIRDSLSRYLARTSDLPVTRRREMHSRRPTILVRIWEYPDGRWLVQRVSIRTGDVLAHSWWPDLGAATAAFHAELSR